MLRSANDIPDRVWAPMPHPVVECCRVGRRVPKSAIRFLNNERILRKSTVPVNYCSLAEFYHAKIAQLANHTGQLRVVEAFTQLEVEPNLQKIVNLLKFVPRQINAPLPDDLILRVPLLKFDQFSPALLQH